MTRNALWLRVVIFVLVGMASFTCGGDSETPEVSNGQATAVVEPTPASSGGAAPIAVTSAELMEAYDADQASAAAQYEDKVVSVSGIVMEVAEKSLVGNPFVRIGRDAFGQLGLNCYFDESNVSSLAQLSKSQEVTVRGVVQKPSFDGVVKLSDCSVE